MVIQVPIRIGVLGAPSTCATTLFKRIEMELRGHGITVARTGRLAQRAAALGLPKMQHHTAESTEWIMAQGIADELAANAQGAQVVLADRAVLDAWVYYLAALAYREEAHYSMDLHLMARAQSAKYSVLLATVLDPAVPLASDQGPDYDHGFRALVDHQLNEVLTDEKLANVLRVTSVPGNQAAAVQHTVDVALKAVAA
ncbi:AAA family ATPase [Streptomyces sp. NPDC101227]|uniref:AAA family ATPase n=1 Tax=Streptomyces sp. NPDC101227 TaxID=3366136 RepID=UPI003826C642